MAQQKGLAFDVSTPPLFVQDASVHIQLTFFFFFSKIKYKDILHCDIYKGIVLKYKDIVILTIIFTSMCAEEIITLSTALL